MRAHRCEKSPAMFLDPRKNRHSNGGQLRQCGMEHVQDQPELRGLEKRSAKWISVT